MIRNKMIFLSFLFFLPLSLQAAEPKGSIYDFPGKFKTQTGAPVALAEWKGTPLVITMTYTSCQFACPRIIEKLKAVQKKFDEKKKKAQFVVITFDPARDSTATLKSYHAKTGDLTKNWVFLNGSASDTRRLAMVLGIRYERNPEDGNISHDNKILITNDKGEIIQELNGLNPDVSEL